MHFNASIMETCVERKPLQHMQIAVNTEMSFRIALVDTPPAALSFTIASIMGSAAPALPSAVTGTPSASLLAKPNSG